LIIQQRETFSITALSITQKETRKSQHNQYGCSETACSSFYTSAMLIVNGIYFYQTKSPLKQNSEVQDMANAHLMKKQHIVFCDKNNIRLI
jgi:hypothetical protein